MSNFATQPSDRPGVPPGIPFIIGNEAAERFSFYGMKAILVTFMTKYMLDHAGNPDHLTDAEARVWYHSFTTAVYFLPIFGALVSDIFFGKYRTIVWLSLVYCAGHLVLAIDETRCGLQLGLGLIALGAGGIKPCVSSHVGDQFGPVNRHLLARAFSWFYLSINFGSFFSELLIPEILQSDWIADPALRPKVAFGIPGVLMAIATLVFWLGRYRYIHVPPIGWAGVRGVFDKYGFRPIVRLVPIFACVTMFWAIFDQTGSAWVQQGNKLNPIISWGDGAHAIKPAQMQAVNPLLILTFVPLFSFVIYPLLGRLFKLTALRKIGIGFLLTALSFASSGLLESTIPPKAALVSDALITQSLDKSVDASAEAATAVSKEVPLDQRPSLLWQLIPYILLTAAEVMVSITCLEFAYTQAPVPMKSAVMSLNLLAVALGNYFTATINHVLENEQYQHVLSGPKYYWFFSGCMLLATACFVVIASRFQPIEPSAAHD